MSCCPTSEPGRVSPYAPKGTTITLNGHDVYETGSAGDRWIVYVYDIFGLASTNQHRFCDALAAQGFRVLMPDFFNGKPWPLDDFPPKAGYGPMMQWVGDAGSFEKCGPLFEAAVQYAKGKGATSVGGYGSCWGNVIALNAAKEGWIAAAASCHPSFLTAELAGAVPVPMAFLLSRDEAPMEDVKAVLDKKPFADRCVWERYDDVHGWTGARLDLGDAAQVARAEQAYAVVAKFFAANLH